MQTWMKHDVNLIEGHLDSYFRENVPWSKLFDAMRYSLLAGGKRIRPVLTLKFCEMVGGDVEKAPPIAAAVEMIHTYSLIHDDLPAMDDDHLRRGRPTCHIQFDEATAILAGDALQSAAFRAVLSADLPEDIRCRLGLMLARAAGECGMVAGQILDLEGETRPLDATELNQVHKLKTSALISVACTMGVVAGGGTEHQVKAAEQFAKALGLAFQIRDDILDCVGDEKTLGKPIGSDRVSGKTTYVSLYGMEQSEKMLREQTEIAIAALEGKFDNIDDLRWMANWLLGREN